MYQWPCWCINGLVGVSMALLENQWPRWCINGLVDESMALLLCPSNGSRADGEALLVVLTN